MPSTTRRQSVSDGAIEVLDSPPSIKRRRTSGTRPQPSKPPAIPDTKRPKLDPDDPFIEEESLDTAKDEDELHMIDLTEGGELPEDLQASAAEPAQEEDKRIKLKTFQCTICFDDVSTLTATHCGHLYCAQCLHSALHVGTTKGRCPMCRAKIEMRTRESYNTKTKGYYPLELKLMTKTRKGKRKAETMT